MPKYFLSTLVLGIFAGGYYQFKGIANKKDKEITDENLFKLED